MPIQTLSTKIYAPRPIANLVQRAGLVHRLAQSINGPLTIVTAPPGFGKTTLIAAWLSANPRRKIAWVSLDEDDNDPVRFFAYIAAALRTVEPEAVQTLDALLETSGPNVRELVTTLLYDWTTRKSREDVVLVFDDYHQITAQPIHQALTYLIDFLPESFHLVFISRADPPLPLGRWHVRGQLSEIRADDLRFDETEAGQFLNQTMGLSLTSREINLLEERTEGWVAGLQLAALSLQRAANPAEVIAAVAGSHGYIAEYLTGEVLSLQRESLRSFLLRTSILERFNAPLCDYVLQAIGSDAILEELHHANLFLIPLDPTSNWFRYHNLFADLLRRKLGQTDPEEVQNLHQRAAEWFEKNNFRLDAFHHWIAAGNPSRAATVVELAIANTWGEAELTGLMRRVETLPEDLIAQHPSLSAFLGWTWLWLGNDGNDSDRILPLLDRAERYLEGETSAAHIGRFNVIRSFIRRVASNDSAEAIRLAEQAMEQLARDDLLWRGFSQLSIAIATHSAGSSLSRAEEAYDETRRLCMAAGDPVTAWIADCARVQIVTERGELLRALAINRQLLDTIRGKASPNMVQGWACINQAQLMYQINDLEAAWSAANDTLELETRTSGMPDVRLQLYAFLTRLALTRKDENAARQASDTLTALAERSGLTNAVDWATAVHAALMFRLKDWDAFDAWASSYRPPLQPLLFPYRLSTLLYGRYLIRQKAWEEGRRLIGAQAQLAKSAGYGEYEMETDILLAILEQEAGRSSEAVQAILRALKAGAANGLIRIFLDEGKVMKQILSKAHSQIEEDALRGYCASLLAAFDPASDKEIDQSSLIEPLTAREIEILKLIAAGMSNPEIAEKLVLSVGTVKTHVKHIYGKLNVADRVNAAGKARALGIAE